MAEKEKAATRNKSGDSEPNEKTKKEAVAVAERAAAVYDPALDDQTDAVKEQFEGRTSDPATRQEGTPAAEVPSDPVTGAKASDAGPEAYPFPQGGDVDVLLVEAGDGEGEYPPALNVDDWVVLDGTHDAVPDRLDGHIAYVVDAPSESIPDSGGPAAYAGQTPVEDADITVRTRDEVNAILVIPLDAVKAVGRGGRSEVQSFA